MARQTARRVGRGGPPHIEGGPGDGARRQRLVQRLLLHYRATGDIDEERLRAHRGEFGGADQSAGRGAQRNGHHDDVGVGQQFREPVRAAHPVGAQTVRQRGRWIAAHGPYPQADRLAQPADLPPRPAQADDVDPAAPQGVPEGERGIDGHVPPPPGPQLPVGREHPPGQRQHAHQDVFGDRRAVVKGVRHGHIGPQRLQGDAVVARADDMDEAEALGPVRVVLAEL
ncbi:hypothetical protein Z951_26480 [Streptomyces sp. PRh5]|nr:hypothetical protein Z951_26480 [Streptomyces sp. PRh5]